MQQAQISPYINIFRRYLREQGLPITQQRERVADIFFQNSGHLSIDQIEEKLKAAGEGRIGKATIYRTMEILKRSGLVNEHDFGEGFRRYEHLFGNQPQHEHLICTECNGVVEFRNPEILRLQEEAARSLGFLPTKHKLEVYGICPHCQADGKVPHYEGLTCPAIDEDF